MMKRIFSQWLIFSFGLVIFFCALSCRANVNPQDEFASQRQKMVVEQLQSRGLSNKDVLRVMKKVHRHKFVPQHLRHLAYGDHALPIGEGQTISQPYIVALMTEVINPDKNMKVLEIGTGSGYQAAVLAELCGSVYTIEIVEKLGLRAQKILSELYQNVHVKIGDGYQGWPEAAPFDAIIVTCAPTKVPQPLADQLKEGGKMVIPVGKADAQELVVLTKQSGKLSQQAIIPVRFVPMVDERGKTY
jgi:protein-L-isoaspartate(D-aspartate) O-methyltransferase